ncbi:hypothetical protein [Mycolicibacterium fortuitum]|uniref:ARB-07466-like C-terminal domain-containing protein n=2 Tax=Mycolicibacterium fortuitum TaxID=1766 RepID=A0AAE5AE50_MYCFO|nr:hypothetical protein [Mycolicibacterium fortuitum]MDV7193332.1 hypothetical protein [Mycolicibacterium fortuitum]MDV7205987.1 hypothetical protein [Mycolicibacterium fortuitum]MDV7227400.1 hypothetical protein [Mycolicibacterium fortuitum]MDV7259903.1 hypothetical protein [Mycolicibacterium fortuitum]MDV7292349.1 hypothetical protein [Mycolicibacterium fortuitum]
MIDALLEDMDRLLGPGRVPGVSAADQARALTPPAVPATWTSKSAELLAGNHGTYTRASNTFAAADDETKGKVDEARTAVADGKSQMSAVKDDYKTNRDRLAPGAANPEVAQRMAELDRQRTSDGANTLRSTLGRMPGFGGGPGGGLAPLAQMMPAAMAPASAFGPAMMQPMNMLSGLQGLTAPATSMLSGLTLPQQVTRTAASVDPATGRAGGDIDREGRVAGGLPPGVASENKLQKDTILAARAVSAAFPEIKDIGGYRQDSRHWHPDGQAIDVMIPNPTSAEGKALGNQVLAFTLRHASQFDINHVIWQQRMYYKDGTSEAMGDRGDPTQNHMDHVHIATNGGGYPQGGEVYSLEP